MAVMAQSKSFFDEVKSQLECSVCQKHFNSEVNEPKILKCLHTFCKTCLEAWLRQQRWGAFSCPTCREVTECPNNSISSLPSNLFCKQLVEIVKAYKGQGQEDSPRCGNCEKKKELKFYCSDCHFFLCEECVEAHRKWKNFSGHEGKEIEKFKLSDVHDYARRANVCKEHNDEMRFFCEKCQVCICRDCAILEHQEDHKKISLEQGYKNNRAEIEPKICKVRANESRLKTHRESLEKRKKKASSGIEEATKEVKQVIERCISLIRQHETSVIERLVRHKETIQDAYDTQMTSLDAKLMEIKDTLEFSEDVLLRKNLTEILKVKTIIEQRLQELSVPFEFMPNLDCSGVKYVPNDVSSLKDAPGNLITTKTEPSLSVAEGKSLTEAFVGEHCAFTVITKNSAGLKTYSETDEINVEITSVAKKNDIKPLMTDLKDGRYSISYIPANSGEFNLSIKVWGNSIMGSPFKLKVTPGNKYLSVKSGGSNQCKSNNRHFPSNINSDMSSKKVTCSSCLDTVTSPRVLTCKHVLCLECFQTPSKLTYKCPVCQDPQGVPQGDQPRGEMTSRCDRFLSIPGYEGYGAIIIDYRFPSGIQGKEHPNPGKYYDGASHTAYLPDTPTGRKLLQLLRRAFDARLVFTMNTSDTTGPSQIAWNDIHHKTSLSGGPNGFAYPDPVYLERLKEELAAKGIY